jgi:hypothetical protein
MRRSCGAAPQARKDSRQEPHGSRGFEDQPRDFVGMGDQREMAGLHLDGFGAHPLGHEALKVRIDRAVIR